MEKRTKRWMGNTKLMFVLLFCWLITGGNIHCTVCASEQIVMDETELMEEYDIENIEIELLEMEMPEIEMSETEIPVIETPEMIIPEVGEEDFIQDSEDMIFSSVEDSMTSLENEELHPALEVSAEADTDSVKAGQALVYIVDIENTGDVSLRDIRIRCTFSTESILEGIWEDAQGLFLISNEQNAEIDILEAGQKRKLYYTIQLPQEMDETLECRIFTDGKSYIDSEESGNFLEDIKRECSVQTRILPLNVDFSVTKTADRSVAVPGDTVTYQICIRNTGERTLHSVLTTERFQLEGVRAVFKEKEGVLLNSDKTQALISRIEPGKSFGLQAEVVLPANMKSQELFNYVTVITKETGEKSVEAHSEIEVIKKEPEPTKMPEEAGVLEYAENADSMVVQASANPKTGDENKVMLWIGILICALMLIFCTFWNLKAQRKH